jgi:hypothetical protein
LHDLYIEGKTLKIRDILNSCLLELREDLDVWLWIDQICVAQEDTLERNHQVGMMSRIYGNSMSVIIWMGDIPLAAPGDHDFYNDSDLDVVSATTLLKNTYFTRLWIVQEVFLANSINIRINGHRCVTWDRLTSLCMSPPGAYGPVGNLTSSSLIVFTNNWKGKELMERYYVPLVDCVWSFCRGICENPRDKVYGLLGMVHEEDRVVVDYEMSVLEVYLHFIQVTINEKRSFNIGAKTWFEGSDRHHFLSLGKSMGIEDNIMQGISRLVYHRSLYHSQDKVTAVGLGRLGRAHEQHHWWYECNGERYRFSCLPLSALEWEIILASDI